MSWQAMDAIDQLPYDVCGPLAFRVLTKLANVAAQDGTRAYRLAWEIASELGVSERSIRRATAELEGANLIRKGDQRVVSHWQGNRRPTVWDVVMHHASTAQVPLPDLGDDAESRGDTVIHSPDDTPSGVTPGVTPDVTTGDHQRELRELRELPLTKTYVGNQTADVTPARRTRCSGSASGHHHFDAQTGWCTNACGLRDEPAPIGAHA
jgi:hypothetical protein